MEYLFVPYEIALEMKLLEFDEPCFGFYNIKGNFIKDFSVTKDIIDSLGITNMELSEKICLAPTFAQCFKFFREKYRMKIWFNISQQVPYVDKYLVSIDVYDGFGVGVDFEEEFTIYEEAELACVTELINIVKNKKP